MIQKKLYILVVIFLFSCTKNSLHEAIKSTTTNKTVVATIGSKNDSVDVKYKLRPVREVTLDNGLKILIVEDHTLPTLSFTMMIKTGAINEPTELAGLNYFTSALLEQGTANKDALKLAEELAVIGANLSISSGHEMTFVSIDGLTLSAEEMLNQFYEILTTPAYSESELSRLKGLTEAQFKKIKDNPSQFAQRKFAELVYGDHPYSRLVTGTQGSVQKMRKQDVIKHYLNWYRPNNSVLALVGDIHSEFEAKVSEKFKNWNQRKIKKIDIVDFSGVNDRQIQVYTKSKLAQAEIHIAQSGVKKNNPDALKIKIANSIFGGGFVSRLNQKLRVELGLTYSINSTVASLLAGGILTVDTFTKNESLRSALDHVLTELDLFISKGITDKELEDAKNMVIGQFPTSLETAESLAGSYLVMDFYALPKDELSGFVSRVEKLTTADINQVIKKYFQKDKLKILIYAQEKEAPEQLKDLNPSFVKVE